MAGSEVRFDLNDAVITRDLSASGWVGDLVRDVTREVHRAAQARCPGTGPLRRSIRWEVADRPSEVRGEVYSDLDYARYVHEGTGLYGPTNRPIRPRRARALSWRAGGQRVFAREVRGAKPQPFLREALLAASPWPVERGH